MLRSPLYREDYRPQLSGHETFPLRYGWLKKVFDAVSEAGPVGAEKSVFGDGEAIARFGVGKNMVTSMRHWAMVTRVIDETATTVTPLGSKVFGDRGLDPHMEHPATTWLMHWQLCTNPSKTTWFWAFNHFSDLIFEREILVRGIEKIARDHGWRRASIATIKNDVACFVRTYVSKRPSGKTSYEDTLESPLVELGLVRSMDRRNGFRFVRGRKPSLGAGVFCYAVTQFWSSRYSSQARTLSFEALAHEPGSPGRVFLLDENDLTIRLSGIEEASGGIYRWSETAGLKQLIREQDVSEDMALNFIEQDYRF